MALDFVTPDLDHFDHDFRQFSVSGRVCTLHFSVPGGQHIFQKINLKFLLKIWKYMRFPQLHRLTLMVNLLYPLLYDAVFVTGPELYERVSNRVTHENSNLLKAVD